MRMPALISLLVLAAPLSATAATPHIARGEWQITAQSYGQTMRYTTCNRGQAFAAWMMAKSGMACNGATETSFADNQVNLREHCSQTTPTGMRVQVDLQGAIHMANSGKAFHGSLDGSTGLPNGYRAPFTETIAGTWIGSCGHAG